MINPQWGFNPIIRMLFAVTLFQLIFLLFCALGLNFEAVNFIKKYAEAFGSILGVWDS
jgi:hypothetical protein